MIRWGGRGKKYKKGSGFRFVVMIEVDCPIPNRNCPSNGNDNYRSESIVVEVCSEESN